MERCDIFALAPLTVVLLRRLRCVWSEWPVFSDYDVCNVGCSGKLGNFMESWKRRSHADPHSVIKVANVIVYLSNTTAGCESRLFYLFSELFIGYKNVIETFFSDYFTSYLMFFACWTKFSCKLILISADTINYEIILVTVVCFSYKWSLKRTLDFVTVLNMIWLLNRMCHKYYLKQR